MTAAEHERQSLRRGENLILTLLLSPAPLLRLGGGTEVSDEANDVRQVIDEVDAPYPGANSKLPTRFNGKDF